MAAPSTELIDPAASPILPSFITAPGETDVPIACSLHENKHTHGGIMTVLIISDTEPLRPTVVRGE